MSSRYYFTSRLFLILALACAISFAPAATFARNSYGGSGLIVQRAPNFGWNLAIHLQIDGRAVANIVQGRRFVGFLPAGYHVLTVSAVPNYDYRQPMSARLNVQPGRTYVFTAGWNSDRVVLR